MQSYCGVILLDGKKMHTKLDEHFLANAHPLLVFRAEPEFLESSMLSVMIRALTYNFFKIGSAYEVPFAEF